MTTQLAFARDYQGINADAPDFSTDIFTATLGVGATSITIPSNYKCWVMYVRIGLNGGGDSTVWVSKSGTATIPAGTSLAPSNSELISFPIEYRRKVFAEDVISFIAGSAGTNISVSLYGIQP